MKDSLWKRLQRSLGFERSANDPNAPPSAAFMSAGCCSRLLDQSSSETMRHFLLEEDITRPQLAVTGRDRDLSIGHDGVRSSNLQAQITTSRSSVDGWTQQHQQQQRISPPPATGPTRHRRRVSATGSAGGQTSALTSRCKSLPGRIESAHSMTPSAASGRPGSGENGSGIAGSTDVRVSGWATVDHRVGRPSRPRRNMTTSSQSQGQGQLSHQNRRHLTSTAGSSGAVSGDPYINRVTSPAYVTSSSHLTLPLHRSPARSAAAFQQLMASTSQRAMTSQQSQQPRRRERQTMQQPASVVGLSMTSPSHFSWPGISFEASMTGTVSEGLPDEGHSSGICSPAADQHSPSLPSSTSTATNPCIVVPSTQADRDGTGSGVVGGVAVDDDVELTDAEPNSESTVGRSNEHATSEFDILDEDYWLTSKHRWSRSEADWSGTEWAPVTASVDVDGNHDVPPNCEPDDSGPGCEVQAEGEEELDVDDSEQNAVELNIELEDETCNIQLMSEEDVERLEHAERGPTAGLPFNETVLKCIASCDKVLMRHSTTIR